MSYFMTRKERKNFEVNIWKKIPKFAGPFP